jgi:hypothetical protein
MELDLIARVQARAGQDAAVEAALRAVAAPSRAEAGCLDSTSTARYASRGVSSFIRAGATRPRSTATPRRRTPCASSRPSSRWSIPRPTSRGRP